MREDRMKLFSELPGGFSSVQKEDFLVGCGHLRPGQNGLLTSVQITFLEHSSSPVRAIICKHCEAARKNRRLDEKSLRVLGVAGDFLSREFSARERYDIDG